MNFSSWPLISEIPFNKEESGRWKLKYFSKVRRPFVQPCETTHLQKHPKSNVSFLSGGIMVCLVSFAVSPGPRTVPSHSKLSERNVCWILKLLSAWASQMSSSRLSIELFNFLLRVHLLIHLLRTYLLNTCHVPNTGLDAQGRNSRIRSLVLGAYPLGAYSLQRKEEEKSNEVPWRVEDDKLAWPRFF